MTCLYACNITNFYIFLFDGGHTEEGVIMVTFVAHGHRAGGVFFFFGFGIFPILGSPFSTISHTFSTSDSNETAPSGIICQLVGPLPSTLMDRIDGRSFFNSL